MGTIMYHEPVELLPEPSRDLHRALSSLMEELEAVDWYQQRVDATQDQELRTVLEHNRDEEIEHAMMVLEWLRRKSPTFDKNIRTYLMKEDPITEIESTSAGGSPATDAGAGADESLGIGSLKGI